MQAATKQCSELQTGFSENELVDILHNLSGPLVCASGFTHELALVREAIQEKMRTMPESIDPSMTEFLTYQVNDEMGDCLLQVENALSKLEKVIEAMRHLTPETRKN